MTADAVEAGSTVILETSGPGAGGPDSVGGTDQRRGTTAEPEIPVRELLDTLNEAFAVELERKQALLAGAPTVPDADAGLRFARGLMLAAGIGVATWGAILMLIVALT